MKRSALRDKSKAFALRIIKMVNYLQKERKEYVLSNQVLRSGTSIGANVAEAFYAQSNADFIAKLCIARKEAGETMFWLELLRDSDYLSQDGSESMIADCEELLKLLTSSIKTSTNKTS